MGERPLKGKRIVLTRSVKGSAAWEKYLMAQGAKVYSFPAIRIIPIKSTAQTLEIIKNIDAFDQVVITSIESLRAANISSKRMPPLAVMGEETAKLMKAMGYRVTFQPSLPTTTALAWELPLKKKSSVLFLHSNIAPNTLQKILTARGATVTDIATYRTVSLKDPDPHFSKLLDRGAIDYLTFASPSAVRGFFDRLEKKSHKKALAIPAIAIGTSVARTLKKYNFIDIRIAKNPTIKGVATAML